MALVRPVSSIAWELRTAWARGWRIALSLDERCDPRRVEGVLRSVSATNAACVIDGLHVPLDAVLAVHRPSRLGDAAWQEGQRWRGPVYRRPQREELPLGW